MATTNYEINGSTYGYNIKNKITNIAYPIVPLYNCGCGKLFYTQESGDFIYVVKYSCGCGGYFIFRLNLNYFD